MKRLAAIALTLTMMTTNVYAIQGEMGYFGGTSSGYKLPTLTSLAQEKVKKVTKYSMPYKEVIYITGEPVEVEGTIDVTPGKMEKEDGAGEYTEVYKINAKSKDGKSSVTRTLTLTTQFVYNPVTRQMTTTSKLKKWNENTLVVNSKTYKLDDDKTSFSKSVLVDYTPGVTYYRGDISYEAVYEDVTGGDGEYITVSVTSPIYGYEQAYAKTETQKRNITITNTSGSSNYYIEDTPTYTVYKDIQYGANAPDAISFEGNYKELIKGEGSVAYNILVGNDTLDEEDQVGGVNIQDSPSIEQLALPGLSQIKGHAAEADIKKMYSMKIFTDPSANFSPTRDVRRGDYIAMLVRAFQMPLPEEQKTSKKKDQAKPVSIFSDVPTDDALYPYMMAAYNAGLIGSGKLGVDTRLTREEMYALNISAMGLQRLGIVTLDAYTPFVDDSQISEKYKRQLYAASKIGLIDSGNTYVFPKRNVSYAEAAAFLNHMIYYLRYELQKDYNDKMM